MRKQLRVYWIVVAAAGAAAAGCGGGSDVTSSELPTTALVSVSPTGGATGVATTTPMRMAFSGAMAAGMEQDIDLHHGDAAGPLVPMNCTWSADRTTVTCAPTEPLDPATPYTLHVGGGMIDADHKPVDMGTHGPQAGGQGLMPGMMGGMHAGIPMSDMGTGWKTPNGSYGMLFPFTTS